MISSVPVAEKPVTTSLLCSLVKLKVRNELLTSVPSIVTLACEPRFLVYATSLLLLVGQPSVRKTEASGLQRRFDAAQQLNVAPGDGAGVWPLRDVLLEHLAWLVAADLALPGHPVLTQGLHAVSSAP